jgi:hypothetical protein
MNKFVRFILFFAAFLFIFSCNWGIKSDFCDDSCATEDSTGVLKCKLTSPELRERKNTVIAHLLTKITEKKALENGYAFKFEGSDEMLDELTEFIKTERACCEFFTFSLKVEGNASIWLSITGPEEAKAFIETELGF